MSSSSSQEIRGLLSGGRANGGSRRRGSAGECGAQGQGHDVRGAGAGGRRVEHGDYCWRECRGKRSQRQGQNPRQRAHDVRSATSGPNVPRGTRNQAGRHCGGQRRAATVHAAALDAQARGAKIVWINVPPMPDVKNSLFVATDAFGMGQTGGEILICRTGKELGKPAAET